jgi:hypothetical protein
VVDDGRGIWHGPDPHRCDGAGRRIRLRPSDASDVLWGRVFNENRNPNRHGDDNTNGAGADFDGDRNGAGADFDGHNHGPRADFDGDRNGPRADFDGDPNGARTDFDGDPNGARTDFDGDPNGAGADFDGDPNGAGANDYDHHPRPWHNRHGGGAWPDGDRARPDGDRTRAYANGDGDTDRAVTGCHDGNRNRHRNGDGIAESNRHHSCACSNGHDRTGHAAHWC